MNRHDRSEQLRRRVGVQSRSWPRASLADNRCRRLTKETAAHGALEAGGKRQAKVRAVGSGHDSAMGVVLGRAGQ